MEPRESSLRVRLVRRYEIWLLGAILLLAIGVRVWGINFGLPSIYHPDEPTYVEIAQGMFKTGDWNPHFFNYPSLFLYLNALAYVPFFLVGKIAGIFQTTADIPGPVMLALGVGETSMPATFLMGRFLSVAFAVGSVLMVFLIGRQATSSKIAGLLAALIMAVSMPNVTYSRWITPESYLIFFLLLAAWTILRVLQRGKTSDYILAGVAIGLVVATKYNGALIGSMFVLAHFLRHGPRGIRDWRLYAVPALSVATFFVATPFALLDFGKFLSDLQYETQHYSLGHMGMEGETLSFYLVHFRYVEGPVIALAVLEMLRGIVTRSKPIIALSIFPIIYFLFINSFVVRNDRTLMPLIPFLYILGASLLAYVLDLRGRLKPVGRVALTAGVAAVALWSVAFPFEQMATNTSYRMDGINARETARAWVNENLPPGSHIALESYAPSASRTRFVTSGFTRMIDHPPDWYVTEGYDYLIFCRAMFGRFYNNKERYASEVQQYESFFTRFEEVRVMPHPDYEVRIYRVVR